MANQMEKKMDNDWEYQVYRCCIGVILGICRDNGKNGSYCLGLRV